jgi:hypothetical protein
MTSNMLARLREEFSFVRGNLLVLILSYTLFRMTDAMSYSFQSLYIRELGASPFLLGLMSSLGSLLIAIVRIPGAFVADHYGRRRVIAVFTFGVAFSYLFYALAPDWRFILAGVVIMNLSHVYIPALEAIEADSIPAERRGIGYSVINVLPMLPAMITPPIGGFLVDKHLRRDPVDRSSKSLLPQGDPRGSPGVQMGRGRIRLQGVLRFRRRGLEGDAAEHGSPHRGDAHRRVRDTHLPHLHVPLRHRRRGRRGLRVEPDEHGLHGSGFIGGTACREDDRLNREEEVDPPGLPILHAGDCPLHLL